MFENNIVVCRIEDLQSIVEQAIDKALEKRGATQSTGSDGVAEIGLIDRAELIKRLGVTEQTIIRYEKKGKIPSHRIGDAARYDWNEIKKATRYKV